VNTVLLLLFVSRRQQSSIRSSGCGSQSAATLGQLRGSPIILQTLSFTTFMYPSAMLTLTGEPVTGIARKRRTDSSSLSLAKADGQQQIFWFSHFSPLRTEPADQLLPPLIPELPLLPFVPPHAHHENLIPNPGHPFKPAVALNGLFWSWLLLQPSVPSPDFCSPCSYFSGVSQHLLLPQTGQVLMERKS
jgi:hypothetical protein